MVPLYNKAQTIARAIESVLIQLEPDDELIIVDDGSTDGSVDVVRSFGDRSLRLVCQPNGGASRARNCGLELARNDFVAFLDADDYWLSGYRAHVARPLMWDHGWVFIAVGHLRFAPGTQNFMTELPNPQSDDWQCLGFPHFTRIYAKENLVNSSSVVVKKSLVKKVGGFPEGASAGEDIYLWLRCALEGKVCFSRKILVAIERDAPSRGSRSSCRDAIPYYMNWIAEQHVSKKGRRDDRDAMARFLVRRGLMSCAGQVLAGNRNIAWRQTVAIARVRPWFLLLGGGLILSPAGLLRLAYRMKNQGR